MRIVPLSIVVLILFVFCNSPKHFDRIEYLKQCLIEYGFHPDTTFNSYREYSWKVNISGNDSLLQREVEFYLLDTVFYNHTIFKPEKCCFFKMLEYQYLPEEKKEYTAEYFPGIYEEEETKAQFSEHFFNVSKGLRHLPVPRLITLQQKITLRNRYILLIVKLERENLTDTTKARDLLEIIKTGIIQPTKEQAQRKYASIRENSLVQKNILAGKTWKNPAGNADTNKPPAEQETILLNNLKRIIVEKNPQCHCVDVCSAEDGCIHGGYIYINIVTDYGLPAKSAECLLISSIGTKYSNTADEYGGVGWCRVPKDSYTAEIIYKNKKYTFAPVWDALPQTNVFEIK